ncbi:regucalcin-like [Eurosta solidaginis]|uniref:regucalcin-like n=1 Tax=Eurosta solidaginis TaxID=178769 RepID=UPI003530C9C7
MKRFIFAIGALAVLSYVQTATSYKLEALPNAYTLVGEGPHWDIKTQSLYFVDIDLAKLLRYDYKTNKTYSAVLQGEKFASFIIPIKGKKDKFVVGCDRRVVIVKWDGISPIAKVVYTAHEVEFGNEYHMNRFNDAKADKKGRLVAGTMWNDQSDLFTYRKGSLYSFQKKKKAKSIVPYAGISNGMTWNDKTKKFYFVDSANYNVTEFNYNYKTGTLNGDPRVVWQHETHMPDGMTIDADGNLYIATFSGSTIYKVNPKTKKTLMEIKFPTKQITSAAFGGPNLDILYVTTSALNNEPPPAGTTYQVTGLGAKGLPMTRVRI